MLLPIKHGANIISGTRRLFCRRQKRTSLGLYEQAPNALRSFTLPKVALLSLPNQISQKVFCSFSWTTATPYFSLLLSPTALENVPQFKFANEFETGFDCSAFKNKRPLGVSGLLFLAAELGFEPRHTESESAVLPLHNSAKCVDIISQDIRVVNCFFEKILK